MPRKKQTVQKQRRRKVYRPGEFSGAAEDLRKRGAFRVFSNYTVFAIIGAVVIGGGLAISAFTSGRGGTSSDSGSVRGQGVTRTTPQANAEGTPTDSSTTIKQYPAPPAMTIDPAKTYVATFETTKGEVKVQLLAGEAPQTVNNFVFLVREGFYNGVGFDRVIPDYVAQSGDPTGTGSGGPGYTLPVETTGAFDDGALAMAKPDEAGAPNNGSQFFFALRDEPARDGRYTVFGRVIEGEDVLKALTARNPQADADPPQPDRITSVSIEES
jgi:cyclophilin family peptidyl-prolyl cis-trans isomerase